MNRRDSLQILGAATGLAVAPSLVTDSKAKKPAEFQYCLNTSTINGWTLGVKKCVEIAARAGYDLIELWVGDVQKYKEEGGSLASLNKYIKDNGIGVANAIGFAPWMARDDAERKKGFAQMEQEMNWLAEVGSRRIAAAPAGFKQGDSIDLMKTGEYYRELLALGRKTGVMPQLEFWGVSPVFYHLGQVLMVAAVANDPSTRILADIFHLFRGGSGFDGLKLLHGNFIEIFHMNDFTSMPREQQRDKDRVFTGDGQAPMKEVIRHLAGSGGTKVLSLELFNEEYWKLQPMEVARTGLEKLKSTVKLASQSAS